MREEEEGTWQIHLEILHVNGNSFKVLKCADAFERTGKPSVTDKSHGVGETYVRATATPEETKAVKVELPKEAEVESEECPKRVRWQFGCHQARQA